MNAWEMAKLRRYYLHGGWDGAADMWDNVWESWKSGFKPISRSNPADSSQRRGIQLPEKFGCSAERCERLRAVCRDLTQVQNDFGKMIDAFVDFLLIVPPTNGEEALTSATKWKFKPHLGFLCLQRGLALDSDFGKHEFQQVAERSSKVYVRWLAVYESSFDAEVACSQNNALIAEVAAADQEVPTKRQRCWARRCTSGPCQVAHSRETRRWTRRLSSEVHAASSMIDGSHSSLRLVALTIPSNR